MHRSGTRILRLANQSCESGRAGRVGYLVTIGPPQGAGQPGRVMAERATNLHSPFSWQALGGSLNELERGDRKTQSTRGDHWGRWPGRLRDRVQRWGMQAFGGTSRWCFFFAGLSLSKWWLGLTPERACCDLSPVDRLRKVGVGPPAPRGTSGSPEGRIHRMPVKRNALRGPRKGVGRTGRTDSVPRFKWDHFGRTGSSRSIRQGIRVNRHVHASALV